MPLYRTVIDIGSGPSGFSAQFRSNAFSTRKQVLSETYSELTLEELLTVIEAELEHRHHTDQLGLF